MTSDNPNSDGDTDDADIPDDLDDCLTSSEFNATLRNEAKDGNYEPIERAGRAVARGDSIGALTPPSIASSLVDLAESYGDHSLRLECVRGLEMAASENPDIVVDHRWEVQALMDEVQDPLVLAVLVETAVELGIAHEPDAVRDVANVLVQVLGRTAGERGYESDRMRRAAVEGLQTFVERGDLTARAHLGSVVVDNLDFLLDLDGLDGRDE